MQISQEKLRRVIAQRDAIKEWLSKHGDIDGAAQKQLEEGCPERFYWHFGYQAALTDLLNAIAFEETEARNGDRPN